MRPAFPSLLPIGENYAQTAALACYGHCHGRADLRRHRRVSLQPYRRKRPPAGGCHLWGHRPHPQRVGLDHPRAGRQSKQALPEPHQPNRAKAGHLYRYRAPAGAAGLGHPRRSDHHRARRHGLDRRCLHLQHLYLRRQRRLPNYCKSLPPGERAPRRRPGLVRLPRRVHHVDGPHRDPEQRPRRPGQRGGAVSHWYSGW